MDSQFFTLWPIVPFGGEDGKSNPPANDDGSQGNSSGATGQPAKPGSSEQGQKGSGTTDSGKDDDDDGDDDEYAGYSAKELKRLLKDSSKSKKDAERDRDKFKGQIDAEERKKNDDVTNLTKDLQTEQDVNKKLRATITRQAIQGAIRDDSRFEWHDVEMVAQQLDPEIVKVHDDGRVEGIKSQLTKVAKDHPFLLKKDNTQSGNQQGGRQNDGGTSGPTGFQPGQGGANDGGSEIDRKKLAEEYPALASRIA